MAQDPFFNALAAVRQEQPPTTEATADPFLAALDAVRADADTPLQRGADTATKVMTAGLRVVPSIVGAVVGTGAGPWGTVGGGALGAGAGEYLAQQVEKAAGYRAGTDLPELGIQTAIGAVPGGKAAKTFLGTLGKNAAMGAGLNTGATLARAGLHDDVDLAAGDVAMGAGLGAAFGAGAGGVLDGGRRFVSGLTRRTPAIAGALPPGRGVGYTVAPDGRTAPAGTPIPMQPQPDGSYARSTPAVVSYYDTNGQPVYAADPNAPNATRPVRGLLPAGARFHADAAGNVAPVERVGELTATARREAPRASESSVRSIPAAAIAHDVDPTKFGAEGVTVKQFSGDPNATDVPLVGDAERRMLDRMRDDLRDFAPERGRLIRDPQDASGTMYSPGTPGSGVADDVRAVSGTRAANNVIMKAIDDLLDGKPATGKLHVAALDAARAYLEKRPGYRGPTVPEGWASKGATRSAVDDFDEFSKIFADFDDEAVAATGREPGEAGFILPQLAAKAGTAVVGGVAGAATGDDTEDRVARGLLGAGLGLGGASMLMRASQRGSGPRTIVDAFRRVGTDTTTPAVPRASQQAQGTPRTNPMQGFGPLLSKFKSDAVRNGVREVLEANDGFDVQRRGVMHVDQLRRLAARIEVDTRQALPKGTTLNAEQLMSLARKHQGTQDAIATLTTKVRAGQATDQDVLQLAIAREKAAIELQSFAGVRSEAGRALGALRYLAAVLDTNDPDLIQDVVSKGLRGDAERLARELAQQPDDPLVRYEWLRKQVQSTFLEKARSYYVGNLLSGPRTHFRNLLGNVTNALADAVTFPLAAGLDAVKSKATGRAREITLGEIPHQAIGAAAGIEQGFRDALYVMRHAVTPDELQKSVHAARTKGQLELAPVELPGGALNPWNLVSRGMRATDVLARAINRNAEMFGLAATQARNEGLTGQRLLDRVADLRTGLTPAGEQLRAQAETVAARRVFQEQGGEITRKAGALFEAIPASWLVVPFLRTPAAIARQGIGVTPLGFLMKAARQGGREGTQAQARALAGTAATGFWFWLAASGRLSGSGPQDPAQQAALRERGWQPNAIKVGDRWMSYQSLGALAVPMAMIANATEAWQQRGAKPVEADSVVMETLARSANSFINSTFLEGTFNALEALKDPERNAGRFFGRMASGLVPLSSAGRTVQQAADPVQRKPVGLLEHIQAGIPGASESLRPRVTRFGEQVVRDGGPVRRALDPFNTSTERPPTALDVELDRLGVKVRLPRDSMEHKGQRLELTQAQEVDLQQVKGRAVRFALDRAIANPRYAALDDDRKAAYLRKMIARAQQQANAQQRKQLIGLQRRPAAR